MNKQRWLNWVLTGGLVLGSFLAGWGGRERARLQAEHRRLAAITGELVIDDPAKVATIFSSRRGGQEQHASRSL